MIRMFFRLMAGIVTTLVAVDLIVWQTGFYDYHLRRYFPWTYHQHQRLLQAAITRHPQVLFFGNSRGRQAFKPALFDQAAGLGPEVQSCLVAPIGSPIALSLPSFRYYLRHSAPPKVAVIMFAPDDLLWSADFVPPETFDIFAGPDDWPIVSDRTHYAQLALASVWRLWRYHQQAADLIGAALTRPPYLFDRPAAPLGDVTWLDDYERGWWPILDKGDPKVLPSNWEMLTENSYPAQTPGIAQLVTMCRQRNIKAIFVWMPQYGHRSSDPDGQVAAQYMQRFNVDAVIDMSDVHADVHPDASQYWQNYQHLNAVGAVDFTKTLASRLGPVIKQALADGAALSNKPARGTP